MSNQAQAPNQLTKSQRDMQRGSELDRFAAYLNPRVDKLKVFAGIRVDAGAMIKMAIFQLTQDPKLMACSRESIYTALVIAAQLGLEPAGIRGEGYLIPFAGECKFMPGYKGLIKLATGERGGVSDLEAHVVYEGDEFDYEYGTAPFLRHKRRGARQFEAGKTPTVLAAYALADLKNGKKKFLVMERWELDRVRNASKTKDAADGPWALYPDQMMRKAPIRAIFKDLPAGDECIKAIAIDEAVNNGSVATDALRAIIDLPEEAVVEQVDDGQAKDAKDANPQQGGRITQAAAGKVA